MWASKENSFPIKWKSRKDNERMQLTSSGLMEARLEEKAQYTLEKVTLQFKFSMKN